MNITLTTKEADMISEALTRYEEEVENVEKSTDTQHTQEDVSTLQRKFSDFLGY